jgi:hypothetical protein
MGICGRFIRLARPGACAGVLALLACALAPAALADGGDRFSRTQLCVGPQGPVVIPANLVVPAGAGCQLAGTKVLGSVTVEAGASLATSANASIGGDLACAAQTTCTLASTRVARSVSIEPAAKSRGGDGRDHDSRWSTPPPPPPPSATFAAADSTIGGDLSCAGLTCALTGSTVAGDVATKRGSTFAAGTGRIGDDVSCADRCTLDNTTVGDEVTLLAGPGILVVSGSRMRELGCYGSTCNINFDLETGTVASVVERDVQVGRTAYLSTSGATIGGSVTCDRCAAIDLSDSTVEGNVTSYAQSQGGYFCNDQIKGNLTFALNTQYFLSCFGNVIGGNVLLLKNGGLMAVTGNEIGGNLALVDLRATEIALFDNHVGYAIVCQNTRPQPLGAGNTAQRIDRDCGPIGSSTGTPGPHWPWWWPSARR